MKRWTALMALAALAMPASAMAQQMEQVSDEMDETPHAEIHAQIEAMAAEWIEAFNTGNVDALMAIYADGVHSLPDNGPPLKGKDAIRDNFEAWFASGAGVQMTAEVWEIHEAGDKLIEIGGYTMTGADGEHLDHGKYLNVLVSADGEWKVLREIWNSSMAQPTAEEMHEEMHDAMHGDEGEEHDMDDDDGDDM